MAMASKKVEDPKEAEQQHSQNLREAILLRKKKLGKNEESSDSDH